MAVGRSPRKSVPDPVAATIRLVLCRMTGRRSIGDGLAFADLGFAGPDRLELIASMELALRTDLPVRDLEAASTVLQFIDAIVSALGAEKRLGDAIRDLVARAATSGQSIDPAVSAALLAKDHPQLRRSIADIAGEIARIALIAGVSTSISIG